MTNAIDAVCQKLLDGGYTCVVRMGDFEYTSYDRGVKPLVALLQSERSFLGAVAADKCVGAGAAHLYVLLGIQAVWAKVVSTSAVAVLEQNGIGIYYEQCVPHIINRKGDGICPMESAVANAATSKQAYELIIATLKRLEQNAE